MNKLKKVFGGGAERTRHDGGAHKNKTQGLRVAEVLKKSNVDDVLAHDEQQEKDNDSEQGRNWYHPHTVRKRAEQILTEAGLKMGTFLVRPGRKEGKFVISLAAGKDGGICHYNVEQGIQAPYSYSLESENKSCSVQERYRGIDQLVTALTLDVKGLVTKLARTYPGQAPPHESRALGYTNLLHRAVSEEDTASFLKIIASPKCPPVNAKNNQGNTALHEACRTRQASVVEKLLQRGAKTGIPQLEGDTALMICCRRNYPDLVNILIEKGGADPQDCDYSTKNVALHIAAENGHLDCIKMLLSLKTPLYPRNSEKLTPEDLASRNGHTDCAKYIAEFKYFPAETSREEWFHGTMTMSAAENKIKRHGWSDGLFLVRKSATRSHLYILVMCHDSVIFNYEIKSVDGAAFCIDDGTVLPSLEHLVEFYCIRAEGLQTRLAKAIDPNDKIRHMKWINGARDRSRRGGAKPAVSSYETAMSRRETPEKLDSSTITLGPEIGEGEYGSVFRGEWTSGKEKIPVAVKTLHTKHTEAAKDNFLREAEVMVQLNHECIVRLIGICVEPSIMLVQELVSYGSMLDFMLDYPEKIHPESDLYLWAAQVASGMTYLENKGIVHRDLAARNILLQSKKQAKVGDFGLSRGTDQSDAYQASVGGRWPIKWYAPECVNYGLFSSKSDVWSYGITLWEMFTLGEQPYGEKTGGEVISMVERGGRLKMPVGCPEKVYNLMKQCWEYKATDRPTFSELHSHFETDPEYMSIRGMVPGSASQA